MGLRDLINKANAEKSAQVAAPTTPPVPAQKPDTAPSVQTPAKSVTTAPTGLAAKLAARTGATNVSGNSTVPAKPAPSATELGPLHNRVGGSDGDNRKPITGGNVPIAGGGNVAANGTGQSGNAGGNAQGGGVASIVPQPANAATLTEEQELLRKNLQYLADNIEHKELVGQVVRTIMMELKQKPELSGIMVDADFDLVVRGFRRAFNVQARAKTEAREKKSKNSAMEDELSQLLGDAGIKI